MIVALIILGWVACGFAAVYIAGVASRFMGGPTPINILFILGPLGLFTACSVLVVISCIEGSELTTLPVLEKVYKKGLGK